MNLCILEAGRTIIVGLTGFMLSWTHSVEKVEWREFWRVEQHQLRLVQAQVRGSAAGMEPGQGAVLADGWWSWQPDLPPLRRLHLAASGETVSAWRLCHDTGCLELGAGPSQPLVLEVCSQQPTMRSD